MRYPTPLASLALVMACVFTVLGASPRIVEAMDRPPGGVESDVKKGTTLDGICFLEFTHYNDMTKKALAANMALRLTSDKKKLGFIVWASNVPGNSACDDGVSFNCQDTANTPASAQSVVDTLSPQILFASGEDANATVAVTDLSTIVASGAVPAFDTVFFPGPNPNTVASTSRIVMCDISMIIF